MRSFLILLISSCAFNVHAQTTWYISTAGSNSNSGLTADEAFETVNYAINLAACGDSIYILSGTYHEKINAHPICPENNRIIVQGDLTERPLIIGDSTVTNKYAIGANGAGFRFRHLELTSPYPDLCSQTAMVIVGRGDYFDFIDIIVHHGGYDGIKTIADCETDNFPIRWRIIDSEVHSNGLGCPAEIVNGDGIDLTYCHDCLVENTIVRDNMGHQIQVKLQARNVTIQNCHLEGRYVLQIGLKGGTPQCDPTAFNADSVFIRYNTMIGTGDTNEFVIKMADVHHLFIENNTIMKAEEINVDVGFICFGGCGSDPDWDYIPAAPAFVRNNIFYSRSGVEFYAGPDTTFYDPLNALETSVTSSHNLFYDLVGEYTTPPDGSPTSIVADPLFCDYPSSFELSAGSPCIDAGDPTSPEDPDFSQNDIGARYYRTPCFLSVLQNSNDRSFLIYPNPGNDFIVLQSEETLIKGSIQLYDLQGKLVFQETINNTQQTLAIHNLEKGIYLTALRNKNNELVHTAKFIKK